MYAAQRRLLVSKSIILQKSAAETKSAVEQLSNMKYLGKALECGEITMLDYIVEVQMYYDARTMALDAERAYYMSLAKLSAYTLQEIYIEFKFRYKSQSTKNFGTYFIDYSTT